MKNTSNSRNDVWWKSSVIYQIYPRSFQDSNGDGIGDLPGILQRLDYLQSLGVDVIWLSPVYDSPNDDNGYDISDYEAIHPEFGTMEDFDALLRGLHQRGMKLIMDLVVNHSSDEHSWFQESRRGKTDPKRDWYIWRAPGPDGEAPNNYQSFFGGSAWELDVVSGEYYLHLFTKKQPDLNWENPDLRQAVYRMMRFWLDKGVDGFRMDVISLISKPEGLPDVVDPHNLDHAYANGPRLHDYLQEMYQQVMSHYDVVTIGECPGMTTENALLYVGAERKELNMAFQFELNALDRGFTKFDVLDWKPQQAFDILFRWDATLNAGGWNNVFLGNHDTPRILSRYGDDGRYCVESAKLLAMFLLSFRGTPTLYQGDELGMPNTHFEHIDEFEDVEVKNFHQLHVEGGGDSAGFVKAANAAARDHARTPMCWDDTKEAGFTQGIPWLKVNPRYPEVNVRAENENPSSVLHFYRKLIALRKSVPALHGPDFQRVESGHPTVFRYRRGKSGDTVTVWLNWSSEHVSCQVNLDGHVVVSTYPDPPSSGSLRPWEGVIFQDKKR